MITTTLKKRIRLKGFDYKGCYRYSLTFCTRDKLPQFGDDSIVRNIADILQQTARSHKFKIWSFCFMPDHLHVLAEGESPASDLRKFAAAFKQTSGYWFRRLRRKQASLKACPAERHESKNDEKSDAVGQGFSLANDATLKGRPARNKKNGAGFTLIEIVITIVLLSIISGIAAMIILQGVKAYSDEQSRSDVHYQAKLAVERIAREARMIRSCGDITLPVGNPFNVLSFTEIDGTAVTFDAATGNLTLDGNTLAKNVSANPFTFLDRSGNPSITCVTPNDIWYLQIDLTDTQGSETLEIRTRVHPMNF